MYNNESFDDYIRNVLGYPNQNSNSMVANTSTTMNDYNMMPFSIDNTSEIEECYPEIYKIVYPMITKKCSMVNQPITKDLINQMTDEIYSAIEVNNQINVNINLQNEMQTTQNNRSDRKNQMGEVSKKDTLKESRGEDRQFRNRDLRDLIQILIIRELLRRRPGFPSNRPPMPGLGRPQFPGRPGMGRPPFMPREYNNIDLYEDY